MKELKKIFSLAAVFVFACIMLAGCGSKDLDQTSETESETASSVEEVSTEAGKVEVDFTFVVDTLDIGGSLYETKARAKGTLGDYVRSLEDCVWEDGQYGLFVHSFYGIENDDQAGFYWSFYVNDEYSMVGADMVYLEQGATYTWKLECFS